MKRRSGLAALVDVVAVAISFAVLGAIGGLVWEHVVSLPRYTRVDTGGIMGQVQLAKFIGIDGWFFVIGAVGGLLAGAVLMVLRRRRPVLLVVLLLGGGVLASWLMLRVGAALGPPDPGPVLRAVAHGATVPVQLHPQARGVEFVWPVGALLGALIMLLVHTPRDAPQPEQRQEAAQEAG